MATLPEPSFIERDPEKVTAELVDLYETMTGKTLYPAQPERIFIDMIAYRESLLRIQIQQAAVKNLVRFSSTDMLEYLGALVDCGRLPAQPAITTLRFTLVEAQVADLIIDAGFRRGSKDGEVLFATDAALTIPAGQLSGDVAATATVAGVVGNGYLAGEVNKEIDIVDHLQSVVNTVTTAGGADKEGDENYKERIQLAPESFSVAGPIGAYRFWAKTAHQSIIDVAVLRVTPAYVNVYPLTTTGDPSQGILDAVAAILSDEDIRPLCDEVVVAAPTRVDFAISADVTLYDSYSGTNAEAKAAIELLLAEYAATLKAGLGRDQVTSQINGLITGYPGVYKSVLTAPAVDRVVVANEWLNCTAITITVVGRANG